MTIKNIYKHGSSILLTCGLAAVAVTTEMSMTTAKADCDPSTSRPARPVEVSLIQRVQAAMKSAFPKVPKGWKLRDESTPYDTSKQPLILCGISDKDPFSLSHQRRYERVEGMEARQSRMQDVAQTNVNRLKANENANAARIAQLDKESEKVTEQISVAAERQDFAKMQSLTAKMEAIGNEKLRLMGTADSDRSMAEAGARENKDTNVEIWIRTNVNVSHGFSEKPQPYRVSGPNMALVETIPNEEGRSSGENTTILMLFGNWKMVNEGLGVEPVLDKKAPTTKNQNVMVEIVADRERAEQLARDINVNVLKSLLQ